MGTMHFLSWRPWDLDAEKTMGTIWGLASGCCETRISGCGAMNPRWWWLVVVDWLDLLVVVGLLLVWVNWFVFGLSLVS